MFQAYFVLDLNSLQCFVKNDWNVLNFSLVKRREIWKEKKSSVKVKVSETKSCLEVWTHLPHFSVVG